MPWKLAEAEFTWRALETVIDVAHTSGVEVGPWGTGSWCVGAIVTVVPCGTDVSIGFTHRGRLL